MMRLPIEDIEVFYVSGLIQDSKGTFEALPMYVEVTHA